jgi:hypothetical protein
MSALDELFWRDEILQALFWMRGEGLAESATPSDLARFLVADEAAIGEALLHLEADGYLERAGERESGRLGESIISHSPPLPLSYRLTPLGLQEGGRRFRDEFAGLTQQAHIECGPGCWCHDPEREGEPCPSREPERARA